MHDFPLIQTLTVALAAALILGFITHRLSLSPIVGYLLAGVAVGPATPGFVADKHLADQMAEIGVILLMFGVGLHFHVKDLLAVRRVAIPGAIGQSLVATLLGLLLGWRFGWTWQAGIVFGLAISVASTVVLLRVLADNNDLHTPAGHIAVGWLVVEDLFTVLVLVLLPVVFPAAIAGDAPRPADVALALGWSIGKIVLLVAAVFYLGGRVIPWFLAQVARTRSRELFTLTVLVVALGLAVGATKWFGVSPALGAFWRAWSSGNRSSAPAPPPRPCRCADAFAVLFFVSVGMLFDPAVPVAVAGPRAGDAGHHHGGQAAGRAWPSCCCCAIRCTWRCRRGGPGADRRVFVHPRDAGPAAGILPGERQRALVAAALVSISLNPLLYRTIGWIESHVKHSPRLDAWLNQPVVAAFQWRS